MDQEITSGGSSTRVRADNCALLSWRTGATKAFNRLRICCNFLTSFVNGETIGLENLEHLRKAAAAATRVLG